MEEPLTQQGDRMAREVGQAAMERGGRVGAPSQLVLDRAYAAIKALKGFLEYEKVILEGGELSDLALCLLESPRHRWTKPRMRVLVDRLREGCLDLAEAPTAEDVEAGLWEVLK